MLIKEFRVIMPLTVEEYRIGQLWSLAEASKQHTGGGEGIEIVTNEAFTDPEMFPGIESGQHTYKIYHLKSRMPTLLRLFMPKGSMEIHEEGWNAFPYCKTVITNPGFMKEGFFIKIDSVHLQDRGTTENALNLPPELLPQREVVRIDIANDPIRRSDYREDQNPQIFKSTKSGRGPLAENWIENSEPVMCSYKLMTVEFKWLGLQHRIEKFIHNCERRVFFIFHRQIFCWMDKWYGLRIEDIRRIEDETKKELDEKRLVGERCGFETE